MIIRYFESISGGSIISAASVSAVSSAISSVSFTIIRLFSLKLMPTSIETIKNNLNGIRLSIQRLPFSNNYRGDLPRSSKNVLVYDDVFEFGIVQDLIERIPQTGV